MDCNVTISKKRGFFKRCTLVLGGLSFTGLMIIVLLYVLQEGHVSAMVKQTPAAPPTFIIDMDSLFENESKQGLNAQQRITLSEAAIQRKIQNVKSAVNLVVPITPKDKKALEASSPLKSSNQPKTNESRQSKQFKPRQQLIKLDTWAVQLGSFTGIERAVALQKQVKAKGFAAYIERVELSMEGYHFRVRIGPYAAKSEAERIKQRIKKILSLTGQVVGHV